MEEDADDGCMLACISFVTASTPHNKCGSDGLPLTPNSTKALGFGLELCGLRHPNLCPYIDFRCGKDGRVFGVSQYHKHSVHDIIVKGRRLSSSAKNVQWANQCLFIAKSVLQGLQFLNRSMLSHQGLDPQKILINSRGVPKLFNYGMFHVTDSGTLVDFPLAVTKYASPEKILYEYCFQSFSKTAADPFQSFKADVWATCIILIEVFYGQELVFGSNNEEVFQNILQLTQLSSSGEVLDKILSFLKNEVEPLSEDVEAEKALRTILEKGLEVDPRLRYDAKAMLGLDELTNVDCTSVNVTLLPGNDSYVDADGDIDGLEDIDCKTAWHLWNLAGGDLASIYASQSEGKTPPIQRLPYFVTKEGNIFGQGSSPETLYDPSLTALSLDTLRSRMKVKYDNINAILPLLDKKFERPMMGETSKLPLVIRENDFDYQVYRMALCKHVLSSYPYIKETLWRTTKIDIPPAYRGQLWSRLLDVGGNDIAERYCDIDKETPTIADRQLSVDIPRCHSYNKIMSSPAAHAKLRRVLKAWLNSHPDLYYWQGLDSLCAVFVYWNFEDEPRAYFSLSNFISKYMYGLFRKTNSDVLQEYLAVFSLLLSFHDPDLSLHMLEIEFGPNLFAITWFLTMFAHVFPLHTIVHLWDTLLLGNASFPLCVGVAILIQLRSQLLQADFNECILFFSELPQIDIDAVMEKSISIFCQTPKSSTMRRHAPDLQRPEAEKIRQTLPSVEELRKYHCCQISGEDLIELCQLNGHNGSTATHKAHICVVDIRSQQEFQRGAVPNSFNLPYTSEGKQPSPVFPFQYENQKKPNLIVVVGYKKSLEDHEYARLLLKQGMLRVCVLRGGIDTLKPVGVLTVPSQRRKD